MRTKTSLSRLFRRIPGHRAGGLALVAAAGLLMPLLTPMVGRSVGSALGYGGQPTATAAKPELPVLFEPDGGQAGREPSFLARGTGLGLSLRPTEAHFVIGNGEGTQAPASLSLVGADPAAKLVPTDPQRATTSYFLGNDPAKWRTKVPTYAQVVSQGVYPGIDLAWHGQGPASAGLEYDFIVAPGADPGPIALTVGGAETLAIDTNGDLVAGLAGGHTLRQHRPVAYQVDRTGRRSPVEAAFVLESGQVRFDLGAYDRGRQLVIDPVLAWSTFLGGETTDTGFALDVDAAGNLYLAGASTSLAFPVTDGTIHHVPGRSDIFVTKWDPSGALLYSTMIGGAASDTPSNGHNLQVSPDGFVHVMGLTASVDWPVVNNQDPCIPVEDFLNGRDALAFKLDQTGSTLLYSTCLGGNDRQEDLIGGGALDAAGNFYVAGRSRSKFYPTLNNEHLGLSGHCLETLGDPNIVEGTDMFITKLNPSGTMKWSTCWGGTANEQVNGIDIDPAGNVYLVGKTDGASFPSKNAGGVQPGIGDSSEAGVVVKFSPSGRVKFSTFLSGSGSDLSSLLDVDEHNGKLYVTGFTAGNALVDKWPAATAGAYQPLNAGGTVGQADVFIARFRFEAGAPHAPIMERLTLLGGTGNDIPTELEVGYGGVWVLTRPGIPTTASTDFPQVDPVMPCKTQPAHVSRLNKTLTMLTFSSCLGGSATATSSGGIMEQANSVVLDASGNAYVTGYTHSPDFVTTVGAYDTACGTDGLCGTVTSSFSKQDAFLLKLTPAAL